MSCEGGWWGFKDARYREHKNARCRKDGVPVVEESSVVIYV